VTKPLDILACALECNRPHYMKIDVQGAEGMVLAGARSTLAHTQSIQIEMSMQTLYDGQTL